MAVSGRKHEMPFKETIGSSSSAEDCELFCQPCSSDGDWIVAVGYCTNCNEYLCANCLKVHRKQAVSRNHKIVEGENMPKAQMSSETMDACSELCHKHTNEIMKFYCSAHDVVGCVDCMVLDHKACKVDRIHDISRNYFNGSEHYDLQRKVDQFLRNLEEVNKEMKTNEKTMQQTYAKAEHDIKAFKKEVIEYLDKAEVEMLAELNKRKQNDERLMSSLKENEKSMKDKIQELHGKLQLNQANELFVAAKEMKDRIARVGDTLKQLQQDCHFRQYEFVCSKHAREMLVSQYKLGEILVKDKITGQMTGDTATVEKPDFAKMEPRFDCEIRIKTSDDSRECFIISCALISSSRIALADNNNNCVKIVDIENRNISARCKLESSPSGIAVVTPSCIAVTLPDEQKILFLAISQNGKLSVSHDIQVNGTCTKIDWKDDKLIILFSDHVEIRNINGKMIKSISLPNLERPMDIAVAHDSNEFYISNLSLLLFGVASVLKYDFDGNLIATYSDKDLQSVRGLSVTGDGTVLVCNWGGDGSIHIMSPECKKIREILKESEHVRHPRCVSFCDETSKLYICNYENWLDSKLTNDLKVFRLK